MIVFHRNILEFLAICRRENDDIPWDGMLLEFQGLMLTCQRRPCCQFPGFWKIKTPNALACIMPTINWDMENPPFMDQIWRNRRFSINKCLCSVYVSMFSMCIYIYIFSMFFYIYIYMFTKGFPYFYVFIVFGWPLGQNGRTSNVEPGSVEASKGWLKSFPRIEVQNRPVFYGEYGGMFIYIYIYDMKILFWCSNYLFSNFVQFG